ncbi:hypothetical protein ABEB36_014051 [Hypothenemus hampei]|uniref:Uncharacterized protein n=1 Tax=Hypothenemus hampei TaxID=57062 RepID=A0ABD1E583_HYPHA
MATEQCYDPYEGHYTDSDEDYLPNNEKSNLKRNFISQYFSDESSIGSAEEVDLIEDQGEASTSTLQCGKKRLVRKSVWKRNVQKEKRLKGEPYVNVAGLYKPGKHIGANCQCKMKCFDQLGEEGCIQIFRDFYALSSKDKQDAYLHGLIKKDKIKRQRPSTGDRHKKKLHFFIRFDGQEHKVSKKAFLSLHGISGARLERLQKFLTFRKGTFIDKRGKHKTLRCHLENQNQTLVRSVISDIKDKIALAKNNSAVEILTFDFQQNLTLPVSSSGEVFYKIQLWVFNFCIHIGSSRKNFFYVYDETVAGKGQNDVAMETGKFKLIQHRYSEPGHSFLLCDRSFGAIEIEKRKHDKIYYRQYTERRKLKKNKFQHIMSLAKNYVPECDKWFYKDIEQYHKSFLPDEEETFSSEFISPEYFVQMDLTDLCIPNVNVLIDVIEIFKACPKTYFDLIVSCSLVLLQEDFAATWWQGVSD